jgi:hypothetical protein
MILMPLTLILQGIAEIFKSLFILIEQSDSLKIHDIEVVSETSEWPQ